MSENEKKEEAALESLPELEMVCTRCNGTGEGADRGVDCHYCCGSGYIPTEFGHKVLALVAHNIRLDAGAISWR